MAIAKIKKIELIALKKDQDSLLALLQKQARVQLIDIRQQDAKGEARVIPADANLLEIEEAVSFLAAFRAKTGGFLAGMANLKPVVYQEELKEVINKFSWQALLKELSALRSQLKDLMHQKEKLLEIRRLLLPWRKLKLTLDEIYPTQACGILLGVLNSCDYASLLADAHSKNIVFFQEIIAQDKTNTYLVLIHLKEDFQTIEALLKNYRFNFVTLGHHQGTVKDNLLEINLEALILDDQEIDLKNQIAAKALEQFKLKIVYDYLNNRENISRAENNLARQEFTFSLSGWLKERDVVKIEKEIRDNYQELALFISDPKNDEEVPVILENKRLIQPFEFITQIYGMPKYHEIDPTPYLAPFFFLYFGFCVSDAGYGLILVFLSRFVLKKFKMGPQGNRFWKMFFFCGISTILIGLFTGSWFGNLPDLLAQNQATFLPLKQFKDSLVVLDPLKEPTRLLGIALGFGIIQVWFGSIVAAIGNFKNRRYLDIFLDQVPVFVFLFGLTGAGFVFLKLLGPAKIKLFQSAIFIASLVLILTQGRAEKGIAAKLFYGIYNLYNSFSGYLSDILSYSRLWALGLVTGVMAGTINLIAVQFSQIIPSVFLGSLALVFIFIFGHAVSFLMNLLGAFVHPVRLQFVEFFPKFFKSGGRRFSPFKVETKYVNLN